MSRAQCGTDKDDSCLKCGDSSAYDCEYCCPGCIQQSKGEYKWCQCSKGPPSPPPGKDTWDNYRVAGMDVISVTGGQIKTDYSKVVVMLHGGGGSGTDYEVQYRLGWFGNTSGIKYVFPTSPNHLWYISFKNGCGLVGDCAYNMSSIHESADRVATLLEHEKALVGGDSSNMYLAGFSEGAQLTSYMQLAKLDYALGGTIVMDGYPLPPLCDMPGATPEAAKKNATYTGQDMNWMIYHGEADPIFPVDDTMEAYHDIFDVLGINSTLKVDHVEPGMSHTLIQKEFTTMVDFIRG